MSAGRKVRPGVPRKPTVKPGLTVYTSKKYSFGVIHIFRGRDSHGNKMISVRVCAKDAKGVSRTNQALTLTPLRWREILPILAEELGGVEADTNKDSRKEATNG